MVEKEGRRRPVHGATMLIAQLLLTVAVATAAQEPTAQKLFESGKYQDAIDKVKAHAARRDDGVAFGAPTKSVDRRVTVLESQARRDGLRKDYPRQTQRRPIENGGRVNPIERQAVGFDGDSGGCGALDLLDSLRSEDIL